MNYYFKAFKNYAVFSGRASRAEYWYFVLFNFIIGFFLGFIGSGFLGINSEILTNIYTVAVFIPSTAVSIRRVHDVDKSGWFILIPIYNLILYIRAGTKGDNKYGPDPKGIDNSVNNPESNQLHEV